MFEGEGVRCDNYRTIILIHTITSYHNKLHYNKFIINNQNDDGKCESTNKIQKMRNKMFNENHKNVLII